MAGEALSLPIQPSIASARAWLRENIARLGIASILLLGAIFRLTGLDWDDSRYLHPDERFVTMVATGISWPSPGEYFDSQDSPLNPYNNDFGTFIYGTFPLFLEKAVADIVGKNVYGDFHLVARTLSACFDLVTVLLVFLLGRRLFNPTVGLLGALLSSLSVLQIQLSHFGTFDSFLVTFCIAAFYFAIRAYDHGRWWEYALTGVMVALAVATKLNALPIAAVIALPLAERARVGGWRSALSRERAGQLSPLLGAFLALIAGLWTFRIAQPYAFLGPSPLSFRFDPRWLEDIERWRNVSAGRGHDPPSVQWADRPPLIYVVKNILIWGLGPPLGVAALTALALGGVRLAIARRLPPVWMLVLVGWPAFQILYYGTTFIKSIRYPAPAYPFLSLLAAALLAELWRRGRHRAAPWQRLLYAAPAGAVVALTLLYALAFTSIYTRDNTRVAASVWIYENVPEGTVVLTEHWDDPLPQLLPGYPMGAYAGEELELYHQDNEEKLFDLVDSLRRADYIFISSNRLYGSIPRIPERWPMTIEYYRMLFSGELGFDLIKTFTSYPQLLGVELNDDGADESFTVYDHPKVLIFKKTAAFDAAAVEQRLHDALTSRPVVDLQPLETGKNYLMFDEAERLAQQAGGTWSAIFDRGDLANRHPIRAWYLALQLIALAAVPLCWRLLGGLPDRGYAIAKTVGLCTAGYVAWLLPSLKLIDFGRSAVLLGIAVTAAISLAAVWRQRRAFVEDLRLRWRELLVVEALFLAALFLFVYFRSLNPDLWHPYRGGEKPMEFAYFNAVIRSTHFPAYDPWFAGGYINYYYFGYVLIASVVRLTGVIPAVAFNLAVPTLFALLVVNCWSFVRNMLGLLRVELSRGTRWALSGLALLGPLFVVGIGNLDLAQRVGRGDYGYGSGEEDGGFLGGIGDIIRGVFRAFTDYKTVPPDAYWSPTRVIPDTVNEFPYFTYLFADFHPHMAGLTVTSAVLVVALGILRAHRWPASAKQVPPEPVSGLFPTRVAVVEAVRSIPTSIARERLFLTLFAGFLTGLLFPLNTWDFPTYALIVVASFALLELIAAAGEPGWSRENAWAITYGVIRRVAVWSIATLIVGRILFLPYFVHYAQPNSGFERWWGETTDPGDYLIIHGILLFFVVSFLLAELATLAPSWPVPTLRLRSARWLALDPQRSERTLAVTFGRGEIAVNPALVLGIVTFLIALFGILSGELVSVLFALLAPVGAVAWLRRNQPLNLLLCGMAALGLALSAAVELYTLRGDIGRFNTVFKFYEQIWMLFALVAAVGVCLLITRHRELLAPLNRVGWAIIAALLLLGGLVYPVLATPARLDDRFTDLPRTLDGMAYMPHAFYDDSLPDSGVIETYSLADDYDAINWMLDNVDGSPVILEGFTPLYRWGSRVSVYTGLPAVLGWDWHQTQQRAGYGELINDRRDDVQFMLGAEVPFEDIQTLLDEYHVRYIYVGALEHVYYSDEALAKFDQAVQAGLLTIAYQNATVTIYAYTPATP